MNKPNNSSLMKAQNRSLCLSLIRQEPLSRAELARKTGLTRAAVSIIVDGLLNEGVIIEGDAVKSLNGRHPTLLHLNPTAFYILGIDILRDGWLLVLTDFVGNNNFLTASTVLHHHSRAKAQKKQTSRKLMSLSQPQKNLRSTSMAIRKTA